MSTEITTGNSQSQEMEELEDRLDAAMLKLARVGQANDETIPLSVVKRLSDGFVPTMVWREYRNLTPVALAQAAGIPPKLLARIENGKEDIPLRTMHAIAKALEVDLEDLVPWNMDGADVESGKRKAESGKRKAESGKRKAVRRLTP